MAPSLLQLMAQVWTLAYIVGVTLMVLRFHYGKRDHRGRRPMTLLD